MKLLKLGFNPSLTRNIGDPHIVFHVMPEENELESCGFTKQALINVKSNGRYFEEVQVFKYCHPDPKDPLIKIFNLINYELYIEMARPSSKFEINDDDFLKILDE